MGEVPNSLKGEALWGGKAIAAFLAVPVDKIQSLRDAGAPIGKIGGQLVSARTELLKWFQATIASDRR